MSLAPASGILLKNRYRLERELGRGGMGAVWRAHDQQLQRDVAVKVLAPGTLDSQGRARLLTEARTAAALRHPGIVAVFDAGEEGATPFLVMELIEGTTLRAAPRPDLTGLLALASQVLAALDYLHSRGFVHRDVKPENLLLEGDPAHPTVKLADLGLAHSANGSTLTQAGAIVGTAAYLAPEQALGATVDGRADLYSLGCVLYELVAGRPPFEGHDGLAVVSQHLHAPVTPPHTFDAAVDPRLERVILRLLAKDPADRFTTARETSEALAVLSAVEPDAAGPALAGKPLDQLIRGRLVGRTAELERLREIWQTCRAGQAQLALVSGEPGIGKTRLARELIVLGQLDGASVLKGGCYEYEATTPYLPLVEGLGAWARTRSDDALRAALGDTAPILSRLVPEIDVRLGPFEAAPAHAPHEERARLFDAIARLLRRLSDPRGLIVFLDDLQWADSGTLALLQSLLRNLADSRVLVLATYREVELDRAHPLQAALVEWNRSRIATRVQLSRFTRELSDSLLATLLAQDGVSEEFGEVIHRETEGNPFFVEEVVKALIEQGQIYREGSEWQRGAVEDLAIPQSVKSAIGRRLDRLEPACTETLHAAAVLGKTFEFADLVATTGKSEDALLDALDQAAGAQLIVARDGEAFAFTHDKIREVLYEELNPIRRRRLHQRAAESLEARGQSERVEELAFHFLHAGNVERALHWSLAAAKRATDVLALDEAAAALDRALECAEGLGEDAQTLEVLGRIAALQSMRGDAARVIAACTKADVLARTPHERVTWKLRAGEMYVRYGDARGEPLLNEALAAINPAEQPQQSALATALLGRLHHYRMEHTRAIACFENALSLQDADLDLYMYGQTMAYLAGAFQHLADIPRSMEWSNRLVELGRAKSQHLLEAMGHEFMAEDMTSAGRFHEALKHGLEDLRIAERTGSMDRQAWAHMCLGWATLGLGELARALHHLDLSDRMAESMGESRLLVLVVGTKAVLLTTSGDLAGGETQLARAHDLAAAVGQVFMQAEALRRRAEYELLRLRPDAALAAVEQHFALKRGTENRITWDHVLALGAQAHLALGHAAEAAAMAQESIEFARPFALQTGPAIAHRVLGALAAAQSDRARAAEQFALSLGILEPNDSRLDIARTLLARAEALGGEGAAADRARARQLFTDCGCALELSRLG